MSIHVYIDGEFHKTYETPQELNKDSLGKVAISGSEKKENGDTRLEEIKQRMLQYTNDIIVGRKDVLPYYHDVSFLLQELEKLQQENERYKEAIKKAFELDGYLFLKEALESGNK